jgi:hypothetical protein
MRAALVKDKKNKEYNEAEKIWQKSFHINILMSKYINLSH